MHKTLIWDLDGTLIDSVPDLLAALNRLMAQRGLASFDRAEVAGMVGDGAGVLVRRAFVARDAVADEAAQAAFLTDYTAHAAVETKPFPDVVATLGALKDSGWAMAVCTNKPERATHAALDALGLSHWFSAIGGGDSFPTRKPDPAHLLATLRAAGGTAAAAVMVGDHHNDVRAASGANVPCIFAGWGYGPASMGDGAAARAAEVDEVPAIAARLLG